MRRALDHGGGGTARGRTLMGLVLSLVLVGAAPAQTAGTTGDQRCLQCHGQSKIAKLGPAERRSMVSTWLDAANAPEGEVAVMPPLTGKEPATRPGLFVQAGALHGSVHGDVGCVECHEDAARLPHAPVLNRQTCGTACHTEAANAFASGSHMAALQEKKELAPTCATCHGGHDIQPLANQSANHSRLKSLFLCGGCHMQHQPNGNGDDPKARITEFLGSTHARAVVGSGLISAATCADCHGPHGVLPAKDPGSSVHRSRIAETCGRCHVGVAQEFSQSVHAKAQGDPSKHAAVCTDCHTAHGISRANSPAFLLDVINECGECHDSKDRAEGREGTYYQTYHESYHGQVTNLGGKRAARCSDCHGAHDIRSLDDPKSRVSQRNLIQTCGKCHPKSNARFIKFDPHANHRDAKNFPVLHGVWLYFMVMMSTIFTFFGVHTILWFVRSSAERRRLGAPAAHHHGTTAIRRFTMVDRINHALVALTFFGLTATGIPLVFSRQEWARSLAKLCGGIEAAGLWHRFFAILLIANLVLHFLNLSVAFLRRKEPWHRWIFGPNSLMPRWKDVRDCTGMFRWFVGRGRRPSFDRWTYWEKFDYWAEVGGSFIIGGSGLLLWFPEVASRFLPGWSFNIAMIVHGYEALLAIGFIFTIHFFNAHVRPGTFPVDEVIFTGSLPEDELKEQRPEEYKRLVETGRLESLRVPAPPAHRRRVHIVVAVVSVGIGVALLGLIISGGLGLF